ncbi:tyrosine-type recombinase/integrase [Heliobacterium chlorum]|uniref:Tyrosine-type recombinase/integrase n=1 Tax=Heliobacterium chlorum TaxID=2698 RepID=A0ABR7T458_HELCL|nr:site-specific integrase [Heliobacterium chlorum]MBC9785553.1 tyrosine-type recombinase/integrase [Heliobacterium chlorum]
MSLPSRSSKGPIALPNSLPEEIQRVRQAARSQQTIKSYQADWRHFSTWCRQSSQCALPASSETVEAYLVAMAQNGYKYSTISRRLSAISKAHEIEGKDSPTHSLIVRTALQGIARLHGSAQRGKSPITVTHLREMMGHIPLTLQGHRDRALLLLGFAGAFRRSELVQLNVADLQFVAEGIRVNLRRSKTDPLGGGFIKGIPNGDHENTCPVRAVRQWMERAGINEGPLFRPVTRHDTLRQTRLSDASVALIVKRYAQQVGLEVSQFSGHSLRAGLATAAASAGVEERLIMNQTGHRSVKMVRHYIREGSLFRQNAAKGIGL